MNICGALLAATFTAIFFGGFDASAETLRPLPTKAPANWVQLKIEAEAAYTEAYSKIDDPEAHKFLDDVRTMLHKIEQDQQIETDRRIRFLRDHDIPGISFDEMKARAEFIFSTRMVETYGYYAPQIFNEGFAEASKQISVPGYPLPLYLSDLDFCEQLAPYSREFNNLLNSIQPGFIDTSGPSVCEHLNVTTHILK